MTTKVKVIIVVISLTTAFAAGRFSTPTKTITVTKTVEVEKKTDDKQSDVSKETHKKIVIVKKKEANGAIETDVTETVDSGVNSKSKDDSKDDTTKSSIASKEVTAGVSKVTISALGGYQLNTNTPVYGLSITKPVLGPVTLGAFYLSSQTAGLSLGLTF